MHIVDNHIVAVDIVPADVVVVDIVPADMTVADSVPVETAVVVEASAAAVELPEVDSRVRKQNDPKYGSPSFLSMPIFVRGDLLSVVNLSHNACIN